MDGEPSLAFALEPPMPNPFTMRATVGFTLPRACAVRLEVFDLAGRLVRTLADGEHVAGRHTVEWNGTGDAGRRLGPGVYLYRLRAGAFTATRRVVWWLHADQSGAQKRTRTSTPRGAST